MKKIKLKLRCDKMRAISEVYGIPMQRIVRMALASWTKGRELFSGEIPTMSIEDSERDSTVLDVSTDFTKDEWREIIGVYVNREYDNLPDRFTEEIEKQLKIEKEKAKQIRESLPAFIEE